MLKIKFLNFKKFTEKLRDISNPYKNIFFKLLLCVLSINSLLFYSNSFALDLLLTQGINSALPIAISDFENDKIGQEVFGVVRNDLYISGQFKIIPVSNTISLNTLHRLGAETVLNGSVNKLSANLYQINFNLKDAVNNGNILLAKSFTVNAKELRPLAHQISDLLHQHLLGDRGAFSTRIAYVYVRHFGANRNQYFLEVADFDGYNPQTLVSSTEPIMSPAWSPNGKQIAYVSFEKKKTQIFTIDVATGKRRLVTAFAGINGAPAWSPDGGELAVVLSKTGSPKIYTVNLTTGNMKQLTFGSSIDTEPRFSPDGKTIIFTSGRGGSPQVYNLSLANGKITRLSYDGDYNARATYTPDQKNIILLHGNDGGFNIGVQNETGKISQLTFANADESPAIAPNGRLIIYASHLNNQGVLNIVSLDGRINFRLPPRDGDLQEPTWSPFIT